MNKHAGILFCIGLILGFIFFFFLTESSATISYKLGLVIGQALNTTLFSLALTFVPALIYKLVTKRPAKSMPGFIVMLWVLWFIFFLLSMLGRLSG